MSDKQYPKFMVSKKIEIKMTPQIGIIECGYRHLINAFGQPSFSRDAGDEFDGVEKVAWHIQFESGERVRICDVREFGSMEDDQTKTSNWKVNAHTPNAYGWIKQIIRDANPRG